MFFKQSPQYLICQKSTVDQFFSESRLIFQSSNQPTENTSIRADEFVSKTVSGKEYEVRVNDTLKSIAKNELDQRSPPPSISVEDAAEIIRVHNNLPIIFKLTAGQRLKIPENFDMEYSRSRNKIIERNNKERKDFIDYLNKEININIINIKEPEAVGPANQKGAKISESLSSDSITDILRFLGANPEQNSRKEMYTTYLDAIKQAALAEGVIKNENELTTPYRGKELQNKAMVAWFRVMAKEAFENLKSEVEIPTSRPEISRGNDSSALLAGGVMGGGEEPPEEIAIKDKKDDEKMDKDSEKTAEKVKTKFEEARDLIWPGEASDRKLQITNVNWQPNSRDVDLKVGDRTFAYSYTQDKDGKMVEGTLKETSKGATTTPITDLPDQDFYYLIKQIDEKSQVVWNPMDKNIFQTKFHQYQTPDEKWYEQNINISEIRITPEKIVVIKDRTTEAYKVDLILLADQLYLVTKPDNSGQIVFDIQKLKDNASKIITITTSKGLEHGEEYREYIAEGNHLCQHHGRYVIEVDPTEKNEIKAYVEAFKGGDYALQTVKHFREHSDKVFLDRVIRYIDSLNGTPAAKLNDEMLTQLELILPVGRGKEKLFQDLRANQGTAELNNAIEPVKKIVSRIASIKDKLDHADYQKLLYLGKDPDGKLNTMQGWITDFIDGHPNGTLVIGGALMIGTLLGWGKDWKDHKVVGGILKWVFPILGLGALGVGTGMVNDVATWAKHGTQKWPDLFETHKYGGIGGEFLHKVGLENNINIVNGLIAIQDIPFYQAYKLYDEGQHSKKIDFTVLNTDTGYKLDVNAVKYLRQDNAYKLMDKLVQEIENIHQKTGENLLDNYRKQSQPGSGPLSLMEVMQAVMMRASDEEKETQEEKRDHVKHKMNKIGNAFHLFVMSKSTTPEVTGWFSRTNPGVTFDVIKLKNGLTQIQTVKKTEGLKKFESDGEQASIENFVKTLGKQVTTMGLKEDEFLEELKKQGFYP